jgi:retinol dehydrogenase 14
MKDRTILITGATSGIGRAVATELARQDATVVFTYRDKVKGEETLDEIRQVTGNCRVHILEVDLASLASVRRLADNYRKQFDRLDVLINNAGGYFGYRNSTEDGFERTFGVNHLSHFLLTNLLKEMLISSKARIINVSSNAQFPGHINFDDLMLENKFSGFRAYSQAKLANIIFTYELDRRWEGTGISTNAVHPGAVRSNFGNEARPVFKYLIKIGKPILKSPEKGAETIVYLATSPEVEGIAGKFFASLKQQRSNAESYNKEVWTRLWEVSEELTGL